MPQEQIQEHIVEEIMSRVMEKIIFVVKHIPQEHMQHCLEEQNVDVPVPHCRKETGEVIQLLPQDRISDSVVEQTVNIPVQQMLEQTVEVVKVIPQESADIPVVAQRQTSMVQKSQKTIEIPQVQRIDNVAGVPHVQEGQTVQKTVEIPVGVSMTAQSRAPAVQDAQKYNPWSRRIHCGSTPGAHGRAKGKFWPFQMDRHSSRTCRLSSPMKGWTSQLHNTGRSTCRAQSRRQGGTEMWTTCPLRINTSRWRGSDGAPLVSVLRERLKCRGCGPQMM